MSDISLELLLLSDACVVAITAQHNHAVVDVGIGLGGQDGDGMSVLGAVGSALFRDLRALSPPPDYPPRRAVQPPRCSELLTPIQDPPLRDSSSAGSSPALQTHVASDASGCFCSDASVGRSCPTSLCQLRENFVQMAQFNWMARQIFPPSCSSSWGGLPPPDSPLALVLPGGADSPYL